MPPPSIFTRAIPVRAIRQSLRDHPVRVILVLGTLVRVVEWVANRGYWLDEGSIVGCILNLGQTGLFGPLGSTQLAPPGFLAGEWVVVSLCGTSRWAFRVIPLLAAVGALFAFRAVARRCLPARVEWVAVALFAVSDDLIYFAAEVKQYSSDLALTLACLVVALRADRGPRSAPRALGLAALGAGVVWCSHPAIFTLAAIGIVGLSRSLVGRNPRRAATWVGVGLVWVASFALVHAVAMRQLGYRRDMWAFWDFAFPPIPPRSVWDAAWPVRRVAFLFANPLNFDAPLGPRWSIWPGVGLAVAGSVRLTRTVPSRFALLALPGGLALVAAYARLYPFHGRLLLFWAPLLLVLIAAGFEVIWDRRVPRGILLVWVVGFPTLTAAWHLVEPRLRDANPYGDRRPSSLNPYWFPLAPPPRWPSPR